MHHLCSQLKKRVCLNVDQRQSKQERREERRKEWSSWSHAGGDGVQQTQCLENRTSPSPLSAPSNAIYAGLDISCGRPCELDDHWLKAASCFRSSNAGSGTTRSKNFVRIVDGASTSLADGKLYVFVFIQYPLTMLSFIQGPLARLPSDPNPIPGH